MQESLNIFISYAVEDEPLLKELEKHLALLQRLNIINTWSQRNVIPGTAWEREIDKNLNEARIIFLLVSPNFIASDYCYTRVMQRALAREKRGEALVIPILLRWVDIDATPFGHLQCLPTNREPVISDHWHDRDDALTDIAKSISKITTEALKIPALSMKNGTKATNSTAKLAPTIAIEKQKTALTTKNTTRVTDSPSKSPLTIGQGNYKRPAVSPPQIDNGDQSNKEKTPFKYREHTSLITALAWSPKRNTVASGDERGTVRLWAHDTGRTFWVIDCGKILGRDLESKSVQELLWSPDGNHIAIRIGNESAGKIGIWNVFNSKHCILETSIKRCMAWSSNSKYLALGKDGSILPTIEVWKIENADATLAFSYKEHGTSINTQPLFKNAVGNAIGNVVGNAVGNWASHGTILNQITSIAWLPYTTTLASSDTSGTIHHWDITGKTYHTYREFPFANDIRVLWSPERKYLVAGDRNGNIYMWDSVNQKKIKPSFKLGENKPVSQLSMFSQGAFLVASSNISNNYQLTVWNTKSGAVSYSPSYQGVLSPGGKYFASFGKNTAIYLYNIEIRTEGVSYTYREHGSKVYRVAWSNDESFIASCGSDHEIHVWQTR